MATQTATALQASGETPGPSLAFTASICSESLEAICEGSGLRRRPRFSIAWRKARGSSVWIAARTSGSPRASATFTSVALGSSATSSRPIVLRYPCGLRAKTCATSGWSKTSWARRLRATRSSHVPGGRSVRASEQRTRLRSSGVRRFTLSGMPYTRRLPSPGWKSRPAPPAPTTAAPNPMEPRLMNVLRFIRRLLRGRVGSCRALSGSETDARGRARAFGGEARV